MQLRERRQRSWRRERRITTEVPSVCSVGVPSLRSQQQDADTRRQRWQMLTAFAVAGRPYWSGGWQRLPRSASLSGVPPFPPCVGSTLQASGASRKIFFLQLNHDSSRRSSVVVWASWSGSGSSSGARSARGWRRFDPSVVRSGADRFGGC